MAYIFQNSSISQFFPPPKSSAPWLPQEVWNKGLFYHSKLYSGCRDIDSALYWTWTKSSVEILEFWEVNWESTLSELFFPLFPVIVFQNTIKGLQCFKHCSTLYTHNNKVARRKLYFWVMYTTILRLEVGSSDTPLNLNNFPITVLNSLLLRYVLLKWDS